MNNNNLPNGVTQKDLEEYMGIDETYERLFERLPKNIQNEIEKDTEKGKSLNDWFCYFIDNIFTEEDVLNEMQIMETFYED